MAFVAPALMALGATAGTAASAAGTLGGIGSVLGAAGTALGAVSKFQSAKFDERMADRQALIHQQNAQLARQQAASQAKQAQRRGRLRLGAIRAAAGASGGAGGTGSVVDILGDVAAQGELERQNEIFKGELAARGELLGAQASRAEKDLAGRRKGFAVAGGVLQASSELAGGLSRAGRRAERSGLTLART